MSAESSNGPIGRLLRCNTRTRARIGDLVSCRRRSPLDDIDLPTWDEIAAESWRRGDLAYKLHSGQLILDDAARRATDTIAVLHAARGFGKTWWRLVRHTEKCLLKTKQRHVYAAPTREQAKQIVIPTMDMVIEDAPPHLKPIWQASDHRYYFPSTGSILIIDGADDERGNHLRGPFADEITFDEAAFARHCLYVLKSVLLPQATRRNGRIVVCSTSPESVGHDFVGISIEAQQAGSYFKFTIHDNPRLSLAQIEHQAREMAEQMFKAHPWDDTFVRRELLCEFVTDTRRAVIPEFDEAAHVIDEYERPEWVDCYDGLDLGLVDLTHLLLGYWDFANATLVIEDEICANYMRTAVFAEKAKAKERELWGAIPYCANPTKHNRCPFGRYSDNEAQQLFDLAGHGLSFAPAIKVDKEAALNRLRQMFASGKVKIHKRCVNLIHQLKVGIWNERRTDYERLPGAGHLDGIDALIYMSRSIDYNRNPVPPLLGVSHYTHHVPPVARRTNSELQKLIRR
jgi:hypothetical protein